MIPIIRDFLFLIILSFRFGLTYADETWPWSIKFMVSKDEEIVDNEASFWIGNPEAPVRGIILTSMVRNEIEFNYNGQIRAAAEDAGLAMLFLYGERNNDFYTGGAMSIFDLKKRAWYRVGERAEYVCSANRKTGNCPCAVDDL